MKMKTNKDLLGSVLKTTQMGQIGIRCVSKKAVSEEMKQALHSQLREYDMIEQEAWLGASRAEFRCAGHVGHDDPGPNERQAS